VPRLACPAVRSEDAARPLEQGCRSDGVVKGSFLPGRPCRAARLGKPAVAHEPRFCRDLIGSRLLAARLTRIAVGRYNERMIVPARNRDVRLLLLRAA
jgi:hypothetical protein